MSGITSEGVGRSELDDHLDDHFELINIPNEWGTVNYFRCSSASRYLVINATNNDHQFWRVDTIYAHNIVTL